ncbi:MAG: CBS domain-containing protein [Deltaproteobacteria bacterium]|nr:CBS domain-containing protein [Deltaproteobacteria bacterium]
MNRRHKKMPVVGAVMTSFPHFVDADDTVAKVERLMDERAIRHLPVQERGRVVGIVSERDLHHFIKRSAPVEEKNNVRARDIESSENIWSPASAPTAAMMPPEVRFPDRPPPG